MIKYAFSLLVILAGCIGANDCKTNPNIEVKQASLNTTPEMKKTFHDFTMKTIDGKDINFSQYKGKKVMLINVASKCGYTSQYKSLEEIYEKYKSENFVIIGFPANNFGSQEPGTDKEIESFCQLNYGVTFPMMSKISVKGTNMDKVYQFLTQKAKNGLQDSEVQWNFQKYLIGSNGELEKVLLSKVKPTDSEIVDWITKK